MTATPSPGGQISGAPPESPTPGPAGLTEAEAARRRAAGQGNRFQPQAGRTYIRILVENAFAPVNTFLFGTCLVLVWLGLPIDAGVTAIPVLLNVIASVILEARAKRQLDRLAIISRPVAIVVREGHERAIPPEDLVMGDIIAIARGDQVVLDGEIVSGWIEVDESLLTGEAEPVQRGPGTPVLSGCACLSGRAAYRVTRVGSASYASQLVQRAREAKTDRTPLQRDVGRLVGASAVLVLFASVAVAIDFWGDGRLASREAVQAAAVLVAIVPQGLVIIVTLMYAVGALAISRAGALVQRINAVESMSRVDTLVLDKTGTLTSARFEVVRILPIGRAGDADPATGDDAVGHDDVRAVLGALGEEPTFTDRTTLAIRSWLATSPAGPATLTAPAGDGAVAHGGPVARGAVVAVPFASDRRWSGVPAAGGPVVLGAPDVLAVRVPDGSRLLVAAEAWADEGLRVLLVARGSAGTALAGEDGAPALPAALRAVALVGFAEELRPDAQATLGALADAGLRLKIASGDHRRTVAAIAARVGVEAADAVDGGELLALDDTALADRAEAGIVFGRVEPSLKARLVRALRGRGHYVAMVGDGVNDIIALKEANLGLAMQSGSAAARAAADVVLLHDSFAVLPAAVVAGQRIVEGMRLVACLLLTRTVYALLLVLGAAALSLDFPMTPRTNSILALLTVGLPTLVLAAWAPPARSRAGLVRSALRFAIPAGLAVAAVALPVYWAFARGPEGIDVARSALTAISVWCGILLIPFLLPPGPGRDVRPTLLAVAMAAVFALVLALPAARDLFELEPLPLSDLLALAALAAAWAVALFRLRAMRVAARVLVAARRLREDAGPG